jgi:hypothetical protein
MIDYENYPGILAVNEIVQTVEVQVARREFRVEVFRRAKGALNTDYDVNYYERQTLYKTPAGAIGTESVQNAIAFEVWVPDLGLPSFQRSSVEGALSAALSEIAEHRNNENATF